MTVRPGHTIKTGRVSGVTVHQRERGIYLAVFESGLFEDYAGVTLTRAQAIALRDELSRLIGRPVWELGRDAERCAVLDSVEAEPDALEPQP